MKLTPSVLVGSMSGTSGGTTAASWKGRQYVRRHVVPKNPQTDAQVTQRGHMARMAKWYRSLPAPIVAKLAELGAPLALSGFNVMVKEDLTDLAAADSPEIIPPNPAAAALFSAEDDGDTIGITIGVDFVAGSAVATHYVAALTCPVDPAETDLEEPDGWTLAASPVLVSAATYGLIPVANALKDYYAVLLVIDTATLAAATIISGGVSCVCTSGSDV